MSILLVQQCNYKWTLKFAQKVRSDLSALILSEVNSEDTYSLPAVSSNSSESVMKGNRSGTLSLVIIILLIDDAPTDTQSMKPYTTKQQGNKRIGNISPICSSGWE